MTRDEHKAIIQELLTLASNDNQARTSELLTQLSDDYDETLTNFETSESRITELIDNNEKLRDVNSKLFLKVGEIPKKTSQDESNHDNNNEEDEKLEFESLFNEKGELI